MHLRSDAAEPVRTIFGAIKYTRDCGITHRDLEPNLLFHCEPEGTSEIMVADFAMSHIVPDYKFNMLTEVCGAPSYMATEIFEQLATGCL